MNSYFIHILAGKPYGTLYIGVTNNIIGRVVQHRAGAGSACTRKYKVYRLVWYEELDSITEAIQREKTMKEWCRDWKTDLIERENPHWVDLYSTLPGVTPISLDHTRGTMGPGDRPRGDVEN